MIHKILQQLMRKDFTQYRRIYRGKFFDTCFLFFTNVMIFGYFMPMLGLAKGYGAFILIGAIASFGLFDIVGQCAELIFDIEGDKKITFTLSMPIPAWLVFTQIAIRWAMTNFLLCLPLFLVGKLIMWDEFSLSRINYFQLVLIFPTVCLFFGFFSLWLAGIIKHLSSLASLFLRFINPVFMFGGYFFTWHSSLELSPFIGYTLLINPLIYVMEGMRAASLGQEGYLPFWNCFFALWAYIFVLGGIGIRCLKKRLDCV